MLISDKQIQSRINGSFVDGSTVTLDSNPSTSSKWYLELSNGTTAFFSCDINAFYDGTNTSWNSKALTIIGISVPIFTITVDYTSGNLNLKVSASSGWTWKIRKL